MEIDMKCQVCQPAILYSSYAAGAVSRYRL